MTDAQVIAIAITILAVFAGSVFNNVRIGDVNTSLNRRIDDMRDVLRAEMDLRFERMDSKLHTIITMLGQLDTHVTKLEGRSG